MRIFYQIFIRLYPALIALAAPFNQKAKLWVAGRRELLGKMRAGIEKGAPIVWIHCSSLGEFEQARPLIEQMRRANTHCRVLVTFFSPSGYEVRKNYEWADFVYYLPMDSASNARQFIDIVQPALVIFVKYEFWHYYLHEVSRRNIPLLLISAVFRKGQPFFRTTGTFHRNMLKCFTHIFVQNEASGQLLESAGFKKYTVAGDTRFDRVAAIADHFEAIPFLEQWYSGKKVVVAGSTWAEDDKELSHFANHQHDVCFIIAPHNIDEHRIAECLAWYKGSVRYSSVCNLPEVPAEVRVIVVDNMGMLSRIYRYGTVSYVGGGFGGDGVHNVLEPAVYGKPVVIGPEYEKYAEAVELVDEGGAISVDSALELEEQLSRLLSDPIVYATAANASGTFVQSRKGATDKIWAFIQEKRLLTN